MTSRLAEDDEVGTWQRDGWVLVEGLIGTDEIDAVMEDLALVFPTPEQYHADPEGVTDRWVGRPARGGEGYTWPAEGPGFRPDQHRWIGEFPFPGTGVLSRLCVHPAIVDFAERALQATDIRIYQAQVSAKYTGIVNYEQPMHTDRNHSWLPPRSTPPWWHLEGFLYLTDVDDLHAPTHLVSVQDAGNRSTGMPVYLPAGAAEPWAAPDLYAAERPAPGVRGSYLAYRPDVFHRAVNLRAPAGARFLLSSSYRIASQEWVGYHTFQSRATDAEWTAFVEGSTPRELALFGWPPPGHAIWDEAFLDATAERYPNLDLTPWRAALSAGAASR